MDHSSKGMFLNQCKYVIDLLDEAGMKDSKPAPTPIKSNLKLDDEGEPLQDISVYQGLDTQILIGPTILWIGSLQQAYVPSLVAILLHGKEKKQTIVARSSVEAEYRVIASIACEIIWLKLLFGDLGIKCTLPIPLHCDNQAAMHITANPVFHERTKHIEVDCHFVRHQVQSKLLQTVYTKSCEQLANTFTKVLPSAQLEHLLSKLGSRNFLDPA
ncbi:hypothetical protein M0R45_035673 [Rubus argutus]|uniref:Copia protein n=1 Tax=Rubus argutus TaxID=59490 RepID=A0AAW1VY26_RUBAR